MDIIPFNRDEAIASRFADLEPNTVRAYSKAWDDFATFIGATDKVAALKHVVSLESGHANQLAEKYRSHLLSHFAAATASMRLSALAGILKRCKRVGLIQWDLEVEPVQVTVYRDTRGPGMDVVNRLIASITGKTAKDKRDLAIIQLLFNPALRRSEVVELDLEHVDLIGSRASILGKGRNDREYIDLPDSAKFAIERWISHRGDTPGPLFIRLDRAGGNKLTRLSDQSVRLIVNERSAAIGTQTNPHALRHTAITEVCATTNGNAAMTGGFARHKNFGTTKRYIDNLAGYARKAVNLLDKHSQTHAAVEVA